MCCYPNRAAQYYRKQNKSVLERHVKLPQAVCRFNCAFDYFLRVATCSISGGVWRAVRLIPYSDAECSQCFLEMSRKAGLGLHGCRCHLDRFPVKVPGNACADASDTLQRFRISLKKISGIRVHQREARPPMHANSNASCGWPLQSRSMLRAATRTRHHTFEDSVWSGRRRAWSDHGTRLPGLATIFSHTRGSANRRKKQS